MKISERVADMEKRVFHYFNFLDVLNKLETGKVKISSGTMEARKFFNTLLLSKMNYDFSLNSLLRERVGVTLKDHFDTYCVNFENVKDLLVSNTETNSIEYKVAYRKYTSGDREVSSVLFSTILKAAEEGDEDQNLTIEVHENEIGLLIAWFMAYNVIVKITEGDEDALVKTISSMKEDLISQFEFSLHSFYHKDDTIHYLSSVDDHSLDKIQNEVESKPS
jgi:hypothetical protein